MSLNRANISVKTFLYAAMYGDAETVNNFIINNAQESAEQYTILLAAYRHAIEGRCKKTLALLENTPAVRYHLARTALHQERAYYYNSPHAMWVAKRPAATCQCDAAHVPPSLPKSKL